MKARIIAKLVAAGHEDLAERFIEAAVYDHSTDVLSFRVNNKTVEQHIRDYLTQVIKGGQEIERLVEKTVKYIEKEYYSGEEKTDYRKLREAVRKSIAETPWGNDPMTKLWSEVIVDGKYIF
jgi:hypothetical protein